MRLRKRSGLSRKLLGGTEIEVEPLLRQPAVAHHAERASLSPEDAVLQLLPRLAQQLPPTERLIVDAELNLGLLRADPPSDLDLAGLYADDLGARRAALLAQWHRLHSALGDHQAGKPPSVSTLRANHERPAFAALAELLVARAPTFTGGLTVVGDAVMDHLYAVEVLPGSGDTVWGDLKRQPGGKGLNRAVAGAELGLDTRLVCALGDDEEGRTILGFLKTHQVDTRLVGVVPAIRTPVTAVLMPQEGRPGTIPSKDERLTLLAREHDQVSLHNALTQAEAVVVTFEQSAQMVQWVLNTVRAVAAPRPWVLVSAAPTLADPGHLRKDMTGVDYLVGTPRELSRLISVGDAALDAVARDLLTTGVRAVCAIDGYTCRVWTGENEFSIDEFAGFTADSAGTYAPFVVALAHRLIRTHRSAARADFVWATAAMVVAGGAGAQPVEGRGRIREYGRPGAITAAAIDRVVARIPGAF